MSVDSFQKLREIDSLTKMRIKHLNVMKEQDDRLSKLEAKLNDAINQSFQVKTALVTAEVELQEVEAQIKRASTQRQNLLDIGGDENKIRTFQQEIDQWEERGFLLFEDIEKLQSELKDSQTFSSGLEKTIAEIQTEVLLEKKKSNSEISVLDQRIESLRLELPESFLKTLDKVAAKNLAHGPFTRIDQGSCFFCRYKISRIDESEIDMQKTLKTCPQCSRIFLPYGA